MTQSDDEQSALRTATTLGKKHAGGSSPERYTTGSVPVFAVGDVAIKLFPADEWAFLETERRALKAVASRLRIPTPELIDAGSMNEWHYIVMTRLKGDPLVVAWPHASEAERTQIATTVGHALRELHTTPIDGVFDDDWNEFAEAQRVNCVERQAAKGLDARWLDRIESFLARTNPRADDRRVLLHTEVMREHLLVERRSDGWALTGLVDFEPAMVGPPAYDFASVGLFVSCAEPGLFRAALDGYGAGADFGPTTVMMHALLHRFSNLKWYFERIPPPAQVDTFEALGEYWFG